MTEVNGKNLEAQPEPAQADPNRRYCDTCKFCQVWLGGDQLQMMCRKNPPQAIGNFMGVQTPSGIAPQLFSQTVWPIVTKQDWCGNHENDPKVARSGPRTSSLIATDTSRAS